LADHRDNAGAEILSFICESLCSYIVLTIELKLFWNLVNKSFLGSLSMTPEKIRLSL
jgi:hypothetical protein